MTKTCALILPLKAATCGHSSGCKWPQQLTGMCLAWNMPWRMVWCHLGSGPMNTPSASNGVFLVNLFQPVFGQTNSQEKLGRWLTNWAGFFLYRIATHWRPLGVLAFRRATEKMYAIWSCSGWKNSGHACEVHCSAICTVAGATCGHLVKYPAPF